MSDRFVAIRPEYMDLGITDLTNMLVYAYIDNVNRKFGTCIATVVTIASRLNILTIDVVEALNELRDENIISIASDDAEPTSKSTLYLNALRPIYQGVRLEENFNDYSRSVS